MYPEIWFWVVQVLGIFLGALRCILLDQMRWNIIAVIKITISELIYWSFSSSVLFHVLYMLINYAFERVIKTFWLLLSTTNELTFEEG